MGLLRMLLGVFSANRLLPIDDDEPAVREGRRGGCSGSAKSVSVGVDWDLAGLGLEAAVLTFINADGSETTDDPGVRSAGDGMLETMDDADEGGSRAGGGGAAGDCPGSRDVTEGRAEALSGARELGFEGGVYDTGGGEAGVMGTGGRCSASSSDLIGGRASDLDLEREKKPLKPFFACPFDSMLEGEEGATGCCEGRAALDETLRSIGPRANGFESDWGCSKRDAEAVRGLSLPRGELARGGALRGDDLSLDRLLRAGCMKGASGIATLAPMPSMFSDGLELTLLGDLGDDERVANERGEPVEELG